MQLVWMTRHRPDVLARATTGFHCKDWLYFKLTGDRRTDPSEANFTFGQYATRTYAPDVLDVLGAPDAKRLLPEIVEGTQVAGGLTPEAAALTGLKPGTPITLGYVDVLCTGLGGGLYDPKGETGCTIVGSTGMHMKIAPTAAACEAQRASFRATPCASRCPACMRRSSPTWPRPSTSTGCSTWAATCWPRKASSASRGDLLKGLDERIMEAEPARAIYHPYISQAGERGPVMEPAARAMFTGLELGMGFADLMRAVFEGLCFASRDCYSAMGDIPREVRVTGGAARSAGAARDAGERAEGAGAQRAARGGRCGRCRHDGRRAAEALPRHGCLRGAVGGPAARRRHRRPIRRWPRLYDGAFGIYKETREKMRPLWRAMVANRAS